MWPLLITTYWSLLHICVCKPAKTDGNMIDSTDEPAQKYSHVHRTDYDHTWCVVRSRPNNHYSNGNNQLQAGHCKHKLTCSVHLGSVISQLGGVDTAKQFMKMCDPLIMAYRKKQVFVKICRAIYLKHYVLLRNYNDMNRKLNTTYKSMTVMESNIIG